MFLIVIEKVADTPWMIAVAFVVQALCFQYFTYLRKQMDTDLPPPDYRFGYTYEELYEWYDAIGPEGCILYQKHAFVDLFPYMQTYAMIGGAFLLQQLRPLGLWTRIALVFPAAMMMDLIETLIPAYGCTILPRRLQPQIVDAAITANKLKWTQFGAGMILLSTLFVYNAVIPPKTTTTDEGVVVEENNKKND